MNENLVEFDSILDGFRNIIDNYLSGAIDYTSFRQDFEDLAIYVYDLAEAQLLTPEQYSTFIEVCGTQLLLFEQEDTASLSDSAEVTENTTDIPATPSDINIDEYDFTADLSTQSGKRKVFQRNLAVIRTLHKIEEENRQPLPNELKLLKSYTGFGGLEAVFDATNKQWEKEYNELITALTPEEYESARASILNAHYTPSPYVEAIYSALKDFGFEGGNILEPSVGSGRFIENMPESIKEGSNIVGIDLDNITARLAAKIYPNTDIYNSGFEDTSFKPESFDLAISNVPFGEYRVSSDIAFRDKHFMVHDYFIAKMIDSVRPGGLVAAIVPKGTMDKKNNSLRKYMYEHTDLVAGVRLPNNAFNSTGTSVETDILILKKLDTPRQYDQFSSTASWIDTSLGRPNSFFSVNEGNALGSFNYQNGQHGWEYVLEPDNKPTPLNQRVEEGLKAGIKRYIEAKNYNDELIHSKYKASPEPLPYPQQYKEEAAKDIKIGVQLVHGTLVNVDLAGNQTPVEASAKMLARLTSMAKIRDLVNIMLQEQQENCSDDRLAELQDELNSLYDNHFRHFGTINDDVRLLRKYFSDDILILTGLERFDNRGNYLGKDDFFTQRTVRPYVIPTEADSPEEALKISMLIKNSVDINYMFRLTGEAPSEIIRQLNHKKIYFDYESNTYKLSSEYLSGPVRSKLNKLDDVKENLAKQLNSIAEDHVYSQEFGDYFNKPNFFVYSQEQLSDPGYIESHKNDPIFALEYTFYNGPIDSTGMEYVKCYTSALSAVRRISFVRKPELRTELKKYANEYAKEDILLIKFIHDELTRLSASNYENFPKRYKIQEQYADYNNAFDKKIAEFLGDQIVSPTISECKDILSALDNIQKNREALEKVKPQDLGKDDITATLGSPWIPPDYIKSFACDFLELSYSEANAIEVNYIESNAQWTIKNANSSTKISSPLVLEKYGIPGCNALQLIQMALNHQHPKIRKEVLGPDGDYISVPDPEATAIALAKQDILIHAFEKWIWQSEERTNNLCEIYNNRFNNFIPRDYSELGDSLFFPGMNPSITLEKHQKTAIAHALYGGNALFAHCVGAGKTFEMAATAMESKRLGLSNKAMFVVPKHLVMQTAAEIQKLYPNAKILATGKKDFTEQNRKIFASKIATHNWDCVVLSYENFKAIPLSKERMLSTLKMELSKINDSLIRYKMENPSERRRLSMQALEAFRKKLNEKISRLTKEIEEKQDDTISFESLGVDRLFVDEAHYFKNLFAPTKMSNVAGIVTQDAQKSLDLFAKCQYLNEKTNYKGIVFATGTPISNSMVELFNFQRYLRPDRLAEEGLSALDAWAGTFGQVINSFELKPEGKGFQYKTRFSQFHNLPELLAMVHEFMDVKTLDMINIKVPEAEEVIIESEASQTQKDIVNDLAQRAVRCRAGQVDTKVDNFLKITQNGRVAALDARLIDPNFEDFEGSKVNKCVENVFKIYQDSTPNKSTQLIFCDCSTPDPNFFNVYDDIKKKLINKGVPAEDIAFIHDAKTDEQKEALFEKVRKGQVRVLIGSTDKLGVGTNIQDRLIASHDLDVPWRPSDLEQRKGRIVRRHNTNEKVKIFRYVTKGTFDAYMWQIIKNKSKFVAQVISSREPSRVCYDADPVIVSASTALGIATGNPLIKEQQELESKVNSLKLEFADFKETQDSYKKKLEFQYPQEIQYVENLVKTLKEEKEYMSNYPVTYDENHQLQFKIEINGKEYTTVKEVNDLFFEHKMNNSLTQLSGTYRGFKFKIRQMQGVFNNYYKEICLDHNYKHTIKITDSFGPSQLLLFENQLNSILATNESRLMDLKHNMEIAKQEVNKDFEKAEELKASQERLKYINENLSAEETAIALPPEKEGISFPVISKSSLKSNQPIKLAARG